MTDRARSAHNSTRHRVPRSRPVVAPGSPRRGATPSGRLGTPKTAAPSAMARLARLASNRPSAAGAAMRAAVFTVVPRQTSLRGTAGLW